MPFIARRVSTGERVDIGAFKNPKAELAPGDIVCQMPDCGAEMVVRAGIVVRAHFAHKQDAACASKLGSHPESPLHRNAKRYVAELLRAQLASDGVEASVELEVPVIAAGRIADVLVTYANGNREAHEVQLSGITSGEIAFRTAAYGALDIGTTWWLGVGSAADGPSNRDWLVSNQGECMLLSLAPELASAGTEPANDVSRPAAGWR